ncbi:MAG: DNA polymerase I [Phycisphaera sp. TMED9]|nr:MAG: DNA polymerase I [Phycisphaera sp. TMED9]
MTTTTSAVEGAEVLYLIDGYAQFFRAYHAIRTEMHSPVTSEPTHMTFGFTDMILKLLREYQPSHLAVVLDVSGDRGTFRSQIFPEYKANRDAPPSDLKPQVDRCLEVLGQLGVPSFGLEGVEADDVIATIVRRMRRSRPDVAIRIISKDKDLQQLLDEQVSLIDVHKDTAIGPVELAEKTADSKRDLPGIRPDQVVDMLTLMGDNADNVPGVEGIGPKTATNLIAEFGSIEGVYECIDGEEEVRDAKRRIKGKRRENLLAARERIPLGRTLITLKDDCEVAFELDDAAVHLENVDPAVIDESMRVLGFNRHRAGFRSLLAPGEAEDAASVASAETPVDDAAGTLFASGDGEVSVTATPSLTPVDGDYRIISTLEELEEIVDRSRDAGLVAIDTETDSLGPRTAKLAGVSITIAEGQGVYVPLRSPAPESHLDLEAARPALARILGDPKIGKIGHNLKFDLVVLRAHGLEVRGVVGDSMVASYIEDATRATHKLDALSESVLGRRCVPLEALIGRGKTQRPFSEVPLAEAAPYAGEDSDVSLRLERHFRGRLEAEGLASLYDATEVPLVEVLAGLEFEGIRVEPEELDRQREGLQIRIDELRQEIVEAAPHAFSPDSPKQLAAALFNLPSAEPPGLGIKPLKKGKTGPSTDAEVMEKLAEDPQVETPIPSLILEYRQLTKLVNTYLVALKDAIQSETGRIHASFNQTVTATGRLSSSDPNLQNIPIRTEVGRRIRQAFVADPGHVLLAADYSQVELRMLAHLSGDESLQAAFHRGDDIHAAVASEVMGIPLDEVDAADRTTAKMINFGIVYGVTAYGLARRLGGDTDVPRADQIITDYKARFPGIKDFLESCVEQAQTKGWVSTILGRRRAIPQIHARNPQERGQGERMAINTVVQGSAADLIKRAMIDLHEVLPGVHPGARMILQIHDELVFEVPEDEVESVAVLVRERMEKAMDLAVPLLAEPSWGPSWADTK